MRNRVLVLSTFVLCLALAGGAPAGAQEEGGEESQLVARPAEIYGCMFREGQGADELRAGAAKWNAWMDATGQHDYYAYILRPHYRSRDHEADFLWMGGWPTGTTMGPSLERWVTEGGEVQAEFARIADCPYSANFALLHLSPRNPDPNAPMRFKNCRVADGRAIPEALAAVRSWIASIPFSVS